MKKDILIILISSIGILSCNNDDSFLINDNNSSTYIETSYDDYFLINDNFSFVYIETASYDDYYGESKLIINNSNHTNLVEVSNEIIQYQILDAKLIYKNESEIIKFNPNTNQNQSLVTLPDFQINSFQISPDNKFLAFSNHEDVFLLDIESNTTQNLTEQLEGNFRLPKWSPDGNSILMINEVGKLKTGDNATTTTGNFKIYSIIEQGFHDVEMFDEFAYPGQAEWSPDSKMVVYGQYSAIFIFDVDSAQLRRISSEEVVATNPKFSTNGKMLSYFSSNQLDNGNNWQNFLTIYNFETSSNEIINSSYSYDASWKNDSTMILYCTENGIFVADIINKSTAKLTESTESNYLHSVQFLN